MGLWQLRHLLARARPPLAGALAEILRPQLALSQLIFQLEMDLRAAIVMRTKRRIGLTSPGTYFCAEPERILAALGDFVHDVRRLAGVLERRGSFAGDVAALREPT